MRVGLCIRNYEHHFRKLMKTLSWIADKCQQLLCLLPNRPLFQAGCATAHLGICRSWKLPSGKGAEEVVQLWLEVFQNQPGRLAEVWGKMAAPHQKKDP